MERYISETYESRAVCELIQNADDAGAARFSVYVRDEYVIVANDGRPFSNSDFESLCRSAHSNKDRKSSIGHRGIGFKSTIAFSESVHLVSGDFRATFNKARTATVLPEADQVPLLRIPHHLAENEARPFVAEVNRLQREGFSTIFVFANLTEAGIDLELSQIHSSILLFLRNLRSISIDGSEARFIGVHRKLVGEGEQEIEIHSDGASQFWFVIDKDRVSIAFRLHDREAVQLALEEAVVHAFLPSEEPTGFGFKINGDFSTDPSRRRVIEDEHTRKALEPAAKLVVHELLSSLANNCSNPDRPSLFQALMPHGDPRDSALRKRSFSTGFLEAVKREAGEQFSSFAIVPPWLNGADFRILAEAAGLKPLEEEVTVSQGGFGLFRMLGSREPKFELLTSATKFVTPTLEGCAELIARAVTLTSAGQMRGDQFDREWRLWPLDHKVVCLEEFVKSGKPIDPAFISQIVGKAGGAGFLKSFLNCITSSETTALLLSSSRPSNELDGKPRVEVPRAACFQLAGSEFGANSTQIPRIKKWRSSEVLLRDCLNASGFDLEDVSKQNLGYDLEGKDPSGVKIYVEVKSLENPGESFCLTSNEYSVASAKGRQYYIALVYQGAEFEFCLLRDPTRTLVLNQKVLKWVWQCSDYEFTNIRIPYASDSIRPA